MSKKFLCALALVLSTGLAAAALPKEVQLDIHVRAAASYFKKQQYQECLDELDKAEQLAGGKMSSDLLFIRAKSHFQLGQLMAAKRQATNYIEREGKKGRFYEQALEMLVAVEQQSGAYAAEMKKRGTALLNEKKYLDSFKAYMEAAELGDAFSQAQVGWFYRLGKEGVPQDSPKAVSWFEKASANGNSWATEQLAWIYYKGEGTVAEDEAKAIVWFKLAADKERSQAMRLLGHMYSAGQGTIKDPAQGLAWFRKAADKGDLLAIKKLAALYDSDDGGVAADPAQAMVWHRKAADKGDKDAMVRVGDRYAKGKGVAKDPAQALVWYRRAAAKNHPDAMARVGGAYASGSGVSKDLAQAYNWYQKAAAADKGWTYRMHKTYMDWAEAYLKGDGVSKNKAKGITMLVMRAAEMKSGEPFYRLGKYYESEKDTSEAMRWYQKAADLDYTSAISHLAVCYEGIKDCGVTPDRARAAAEYTRVIALNKDAYWYFKAKAHRDLAKFYFGSNKVDPDWRKAEASLQDVKGVLPSGKTDTEGDYFLALIKSTSPMDDQRDGKAAAALLSPYTDKTWQMFMIRAAVHAELGQFDQAVAAQQQAVVLAKDKDMDKNRSLGDWGRQLQAQLENYQKKQPWRYSGRAKAPAPVGRATEDMPNY